MTKGSLEIHSENILPIIKKWLYSDRDIFVRELVSNACDAIQKVKILRDRGEVNAVDSEFRIDIKIDKDKKTLTFTDTGIGMDAEEVKKYIAQIAFSGAEDFVGRYQTQNEKDQFIGHFGLGFYSAYMVADKVEINTLSYKEGAEPVFWSCDGSSEYTLEKGTRSSRGTEITLFISAENEDFLNENKLEHIAQQYCAFLPYPIFLEDNLINKEQPLWIKAPSECTEKDYLDFYHHLYPMEPDPLFWVHLNVDYPFHLKGILYFPKLKKDFDLSKNSVKLYCNRVFVSDNCKDVIPEYLMVLRGIIDSPDIPLNVSRSYLQMDKTVRQLALHISKKVADSLSTLYKTDRERYIKSWSDISTVVKLGAIQDDKFYEKVKDLIIWKNTSGEWETTADYLARNEDKIKNTILYTLDETHHKQVIEMYRQKGIEVLSADTRIDPYLINTLETKISPVVFQRIDANIHEHLIDTAREKTILDAEGRTEASKIAAFFKKQLDHGSVEIEAKSLADDHLPGLVVIDENQRRLRDYMMAVDYERGKEFQKEQKKTFVVNTNSPLIASLEKLGVQQPELAKNLVQEIYQLSLLSQKEMEASDLHEFITRTHQVLEELVKLAVEKP